MDEDIEPPYGRGQGVLVRVVDKVYGSVRSGQPTNYWRCYWAKCEAKMASLESWLPASSWVNMEFERFVPSKYEICFHGPTADGEWVPAKSILTTLPAETSGLLDASAIYPTRPGYTPTGDHIGCASLGMADARTVNESLVAMAALFGPTVTG